MDPEQLRRQVIDDLSTLRAVADPLRLNLLGLLDTPKTAKELADAVGVVPNKLYYHLRRLQDHGLVDVDTSGAERRYRAAARGYTVSDELNPVGDDAANLVRAVFDSVSSIIQTTVRRAPRKQASLTSVSVQQVTATLTPAQLETYRNRISEVMRELDSRPPSRGRQAAEYGFLFAVFPGDESGA